MCELREALELCGVKDPAKWLDRQFSAETPSRIGWQHEVFESLEKKGLLIMPSLALIEVHARVPDIQKVKDKEFRTFLDMVDRTKVHLFKAGKVLYYLIYKDKEPITGICLDDSGAIGRITPDDWALILLESWTKNPDRDLAHRARQYLCDMVAKGLT